MKILLIFLCTYVVLLSNTPKILAATIETGGTDFINYDLGAYQTTPSSANWLKLDSQGGIKTVIGAYDLDPSKVHSQLDAMCQSGQKKIGFMVWHSRFAPYPQTSLFPGQIPDQTYPVDGLGFYTNSIGGKLQPRQESNLRKIVEYIAKKGCFNEIQFRFAPTWYSYIGDWGLPTDWKTPSTGWQENVYLENFAFVKFVRNVIKTTLSSNGSAIKVFFDLGAETGGATFEYLVADNDPLKTVKVPYYQALTEMYQKRILTDYNREFGMSDTYGFSIALVPGRFTRLMAVYNAVGIHPPQHAIDIYDIPNTGMKSQLDTLFTEIQATGETTKPIVVQETYFNDSRAFNEIMEVKNRLGLNIRTIMQWQMERAKTYQPGTQIFTHFTTTGSQYVYQAASGSISCTPSTIILKNGELGTASIKSTTSHLGTGMAQVCVANANQSKTEMATFSGNNETLAPWIQPDKTYTFSLFQVFPLLPCQGNLLASCTVKGVTSTSFPGDFNGDSHVNIYDYNIVVTGFGSTYTIFDYNAVVENYGK